MEIRALQVEDIFTVARMLGKVTKSARSELASVLVSSYDEVTNEAVKAGTGGGKQLTLACSPVQENSEVILSSNRTLKKDVDYTIDYSNGEILLTPGLQFSRGLTASYSAKRKSNATELGMMLFQSLVTDAEEDLKAWLASLAGKTKQITKNDETVTVPDVEAFKAMPATAVLDVIEGLFAQEGIKDFFRRASSLAGKFLSAD